MAISLRAKIFLAFALLAGGMAGVTTLSVRALSDQAETARTAGQRHEALSQLYARLSALPTETEGLVLRHLLARTEAAKAEIEARLVAAEVREGLALAELGPAAGDLAVAARQAQEVRGRILAISGRNILGQAQDLALGPMPGLRAEVLMRLQSVGNEAGRALAAGRLAAAVQALAEAQKTALLALGAGSAPDLAPLTRAEAERRAARAEFHRLAALAPGWSGLAARLDGLKALDDRIASLLRDGGGGTAEGLFTTVLQPMDRARMERLSALEAAAFADQRASLLAAEAAARSRQLWMILLADAALICGFVVVALGLGRIGRGLEGAVRLAERMAGMDGGWPTWTRGTISGRLTSALVRLSAGQSAVLASLDAVAAGRGPRSDLPEPFRQRMAALQALVPRDAGLIAAGLDEAREAVARLEHTVHAALLDGEALRDEADRLALALNRPREVRMLEASGPEAERHALIVARHVATLALAGQQVQAVAQELDPEREPEPMRMLRLA